LEFNVPFQHRYGYIRDNIVSRNCCIYYIYLAVLRAAVISIITTVIIIRPITYVNAACCYRRSIAWSIGLSVAIVSPAKIGQSIEMPFGLWTRVGSIEPCVTCGCNGATWQIPLNHPYAAAMRHFCQIILRPLVIMAALFYRCGYYLLLLSFFFSRLISAAAGWMSTILWHMVWP